MWLNIRSCILYEWKTRNQKQAVWPLIWHPESPTYKCLDIKYIRHFSQMDIVEPGIGVKVTESSFCPLTHPKKQTLPWRKLLKERTIAMAVKWYHDENTNDSRFSSHFDKENKTCLVQRIQLLSLYNHCFCLTLYVTYLFEARDYCSVWGNKECEIRVGWECGITKS